LLTRRHEEIMIAEWLTFSISNEAKTALEPSSATGIILMDCAAHFLNRR
jgi:hypothetical protein